MVSRCRLGLAPTASSDAATTSPMTTLRAGQAAIGAADVAVPWVAMAGFQAWEFTPEYKDEAVKLVINTGRAVATVARELGINEATLGRWVNSFKASLDAGEGALSETERAELARLRKETLGDT